MDPAALACALVSRVCGQLRRKMSRQLASKLPHVPFHEAARFTRLVIRALWCCIVVDYHDVGGVLAYRGRSVVRRSGGRSGWLESACRSSAAVMVAEVALLAYVTYSNSRSHPWRSGSSRLRGATPRTRCCPCTPEQTECGGRSVGEARAKGSEWSAIEVVVSSIPSPERPVEWQPWPPDGWMVGDLG